MVKMGNVWDRTVEFLGDNLATILPIAIFALLVPTSIRGSLADLQANGAYPVRVGLVILALGFSILSIWAQLAIAGLAIDPAIGRGATAAATRRLLPAIGLYLLVFAVVAAVIAGQAIVIAAARGYDLTQFRWGQHGMQFQLPENPGAGVVVLLLVELAAAFVLAVRLAPLTGVIFAERRGIGAIARAFRLTRGLTWKLIGVVLLYAVVAWVAGAAVQFVFGSIMRLIAGGEGPVTIAGVVTSTLVAAVGATFTVLATVFCAKLYVATVRAHEAPRADAAPHSSAPHSPALDPLP